MTFSWILLRKNYENAETAKAVRDLFRWCLQDGQSYSAQLGYVPVPSSVSEKALAALNSIKSGANSVRLKSENRT